MRNRLKEAGTKAINTTLGTAALVMVCASAHAAAIISVTKDATTTFTRTYLWDIDKTVSSEELTLRVGETGDVTYTVLVDQYGYTDSDWAVSGGIYIYNTGDTAASFTISDVIGSVVAALDCGGVDTVAAGGSVRCNYWADLASGVDAINTATVTVGGVDYTATAGVIFEDPTLLVNGTVNITDTFAGPLGSTSNDATFTYGRTFGLFTEPGVSSFDNTASIVETGQSDSATVRVTVVPEPGTVALLGLGLAGLLAARRRR